MRLIKLNWLTPLALLSIRYYQRYLSPFKGFSCAYRIHTGNASCSTFAARAIRRYGLIKGIFLLRQRLHACSRVYHQHHAHKFVPQTQRGDCDVPCHGCDVPDHCEIDNVLDCVECGDCNLGESKKSKPKPSK